MTIRKNVAGARTKRKTGRVPAVLQASLYLSVVLTVFILEACLCGVQWRPHAEAPHLAAMPIHASIGPRRCSGLRQPSKRLHRTRTSFVRNTPISQMVAALRVHWEGVVGLGLDLLAMTLGIVLRSRPLRASHFQGR